MADENRRSDPFREGVRAVTGFLGALKDAIEESFDDLREKGDLSPERAKEAARSTMKKAQETMDEMRDRLDFVTQKEFDALRDEVAALRKELEAHRAAGGTAHPHDHGTGESGGGSGGFTVEGG